MTNRPSIAAPILAVLTVLTIMLLTLASYVGGYFWLGQRRDVVLGPNSATPQANCILRTYPYAWQMKTFKPAAKLEGWFSGHAVVLAYDSSGE